MVGVIVANANLCVPRCERNGFPALHYTQNSPNLYWFSFFPSSISGTGINVGLGKNLIFRYRGYKCGVIKALSKGESDLPLPNGNLLENDFQFKPSFDEYVKVMESVRTKRYERRSGDSNRLKMKENASVNSAESTSIFKMDKHGEVAPQLDDPNKSKMKENVSTKSAESTSISKIDNEKNKVTVVHGNVGVKNMVKRVDRKDLFNNTERITHRKDLSGNKFDNKRKEVTRSKYEVKGEVTPFGSQVNNKQHEEKRKGNWSNNETLPHFKANTRSKYEVKGEVTPFGSQVNDKQHEERRKGNWSNNETLPHFKANTRSKYEVKGEVTPFGSQVNDKQHEERRKGNWSNSETLLHFKANTRSKYEVKGEVTPFGSQVNDKQHEERRKGNWSNNETLPHFKANTLDAKRERYQLCDRSSMKMSGKIWVDEDTKPAKNVLKVGKSGVQLARNCIPGDKLGRKKTEQLYQGLSKSGKPFIEFAEESSLEVEHAAFKNFDEVDIIDKTRVSKMEMEERIQMLSKRLNGADIDMPEWMFSQMMRSAKIRYSDHSILRVIQVLGKLGNWRRVLQVIEWLQMRERFVSHKLRFIYTTALDVLGKARRPVEALNVFHAMQQHFSSYPDLVAYHSIAVTLGQAGYMRELFDVIDSMRSPPKKKFKTGALEKWDPRLEPDIVIYNAVLNACVKRKNWEGAFWVLEELKKQDLRPSTSTYGLVMEVMLECGKYNLVHEFFRKVQRSSIPNALTYKVLVNTLGKEGKTDEAVLTIQNMERRGIVGSAALYYDFARCLCSAGRYKEALMQVEKICKVANKPLVVTYTGLIQACLDSKNLQNAVYIFNHMKAFCSPNLVTYNILLKGYLEHGMFDEARELFQNLSEHGRNISTVSDYRNRVLPDIYTFNTMLDASFAEKRWGDLSYFYNQMLLYGYHFNPKRHLRMILEAGRAGKDELLETTWKHLVQADRAPPPPLIKERFSTKLARGDYAEALSCISNHHTSNAHDFSKSAWLNLLKEKRFSEDTIIQVIHKVSMVLTRNDSPNPVFQNLLLSCKEFCRTRFSVADHKLEDIVCTDETQPASYNAYVT